MNEIQNKNSFSDNFLKALEMKTELFLKNIEIQSLNMELNSEKFLHLYYKNLCQNLIRGEEIC